MKPKKDRVIKDVKAEYIKRMKSPAYVKSVKRTVELVRNINLYYYDNRLKDFEIRKIAHYFSEDIKNPIMRPNQIIEEKSEDVLTDSLKM